MTASYRLYWIDAEEGDIVTFDGAPSEKYSRTSGVSTDTTISKKVVYWFGATIGNLTINGSYISFAQKSKIDAIVNYIANNETYVYFEDGIYKYTVLDVDFTTTDIIGDADEDASYGYTLSFTVLERELLEV